MCFNLNKEIGETLEACETLFILGFNVTGLDAPTQIKVSYTFKVRRGC